MRINYYTLYQIFCVALQTFIQQDPLQTSNVLQLLLTEYDKSDILAPLFHPNLCPQQFVEMYGSSVSLAAKEGPVVAFSVLTKVRGVARGVANSGGGACGCILSTSNGQL